MRYGDYEHDWMLCPDCVRGYEEQLEAEHLSEFGVEDQQREESMSNKNKRKRKQDAAKRRRRSVGHPDHYGGRKNPHEVIKCLEAWGLEERDALAWNAVKCLGSAYAKGDDPTENFHKAAWYSLRRAAILEGRDPDYYNDMIDRPEVGVDPDESGLCDVSLTADCEHDATREFEGLDLCDGHFELAQIPHFRKKLMEVHEAKASGKRRSTSLLEGAGFDVELYDKITAFYRSDMEQQAMDAAAEVDALQQKLREAHERVPREINLALFRCLEIVERAYGKCLASWQIRQMGGDALKIDVMVNEEARCLGCKGGSVHHTCGRRPDAARCQRCMVKLSTSVHDCEGMGTPPDHYVTFLENELRKLRKVLVEEFEVVPSNGAAGAAIELLRKLRESDDEVRLTEDVQTEHQARIERMMEGYGQVVLARPGQRDEETRVLRARLILEECLETIWDGLRVNMTLRWSGTAPDTGKPTGCAHHVKFEAIEFEAYGDGADLVELADGCADVSVVTIGTLSAFGIRDGALLREVDENNLAKIQGGHRDEHGKFIKPEGHKPPDVAGLLKAQGWS